MATTVYTCSACRQIFYDERSLSTHMITNHSTKTETTEEGEAK